MGDVGFGYCIVPSTDLSGIDFSQVLEKDKNTVGKSLDGASTLLKWRGSKPATLSSYSAITYTEALALVRSDTWREDP